MKNNLFKKIEYMLYNFKILDTKIKNIDIDINSLINDISCSGVSYEERTGPTNAFSSSVENEVIKREEFTDDKIKSLRIKKQHLINEKEKIQNALSHLSDEEYKLVELRYFSRNKIKWISIAMKLGYDESHCKNMRVKVIKKLQDILDI